MSRSLEYTVVDVFAERPLEGNPLAVFHDGRGLSSEEMQSLARETNLSETTFVLPSDDPAQDVREGVRVRIFTTSEELPFAGHPTLGTASWLHLYHAGLRGQAELTLRLSGGPIRVQFAAGASVAGGTVATMRQNDPVFGATFARDEIARILGLMVSDLLAGPAPQSVSTGNAFCIVAVRDVATLERLAIPQREATAWLRERGVRWFYVLAPVGRAHWRARMQWESGEDPATGSAAGPAIGWLVRYGLAAADTETLIEQGVEIHRPSRILVRAAFSKALTEAPPHALTGERVSNIDVTGRTICVATGSYFVA